MTEIMSTSSLSTLPKSKPSNSRKRKSIAEETGNERQLDSDGGGGYGENGKDDGSTASGDSHQATTAKQSILWGCALCGLRRIASRFNAERHIWYVDRVCVCVRLSWQVLQQKRGEALAHYITVTAATSFLNRSALRDRVVVSLFMVANA